MDKVEQPTIAEADIEAEAAFDRHIVETIGWTKFASMQSAESGADYGRGFKAGYLHRTTSLAAQDGLVEALDDATLDEIILNFAGGVVQVPSEHNPRGYVSYYRPREAMRQALSAIKEQHHD